MGIVARRLPRRRPLGVRDPVEQRFPLRVGPLRDGALDADAGSADRRVGGQRGDDEARSRGLLGGGESQVGDLDAHP